MAIKDADWRSGGEEGRAIGPGIWAREFHKKQPINCFLTDVSRYFKELGALMCYLEL